jgi:hypothetical protein
MAKKKTHKEEPEHFNEFEEAAIDNGDLKPEETLEMEQAHAQEEFKSAPLAPIDDESDIKRPTLTGEAKKQKPRYEHPGTNNMKRENLENENN